MTQTKNSIDQETATAILNRLNSEFRGREDEQMSGRDVITRVQTILTDFTRKEG